jgi:hypothetical protein
MDQTTYVSYGCRVADGAPTTRVGVRRDIPAGAAPPKQFLDKRLAHPKEGRDGPLRAKPLITGAENLLSQVQGVGFHNYQYNGEFPYVQMRTALDGNFSI